MNLLFIHRLDEPDSTVSKYMDKDSYHIWKGKSSYTFFTEL